MIKQTIGFNWGAAGVSTGLYFPLILNYLDRSIFFFLIGVWSGVRLIDVLRLVNVENINDFPVGLFVRFASEHEKGGDKLPGGVYGTSIPLEKAVRNQISQVFRRLF